MNPPKNKTSQRKRITSESMSKNGIGIADKEAKVATKKQTVNALLLVYPPIHAVVINPPTSTPIVGPVREDAAYKIYTLSTSAPITTYR